MSAERMKGRKLFTGGWKLIMEGGASTVLLTAAMAGVICGVLDEATKSEGWGLSS